MLYDRILNGVLQCMGVRESSNKGYTNMDLDGYVELHFSAVDGTVSDKAPRVSTHPSVGIVTPNRLWAAYLIADTPRIYRRLHRIAAFGVRVGIIKPA
jgi:hypothetical protein